MRTAEEWLETYGESHQDPVNKRIHWICVPAIMLSLLALLSLLPSPVPGAHWGVLFLLAATLYYAALSVPLALGMAAIGGAMIAFIPVLESLPGALWLSAVGIFVVAWIGQFIGHKIEGKKPSFFQDLQFLLIGPMWLLAHVFRAAGVKF